MPGEPDELADVAPEDFVAARDALAKRLKAEGEVALAAEVKKRRRPTVDVWIAGQVVRRHDDVVDRLRAASKAVADAQERAITDGDRDGLRDAMAHRRDALRALGSAVDQVIASSGRPATYRDEVLARIEADVTAEVASGTFGLPDDLELPTRATADGDGGGRAGAAAREAEERRRAEAEAAISAAEARVERARRELEKAESALRSAQEAARAGRQ